MDNVEDGSVAFLAAFISHSPSTSEIGKAFYALFVAVVLPMASKPGPSAHAGRGSHQAPSELEAGLPSQPKVTPKQLRSAHGHLAQHLEILVQHAALLHRIHYKSRAQHRRAKWFQAADGVRRCLGHLLGRSESRQHRYTLGVDVEGSLPNRTRKRKRFMDRYDETRPIPETHADAEARGHNSGEESPDAGRIAEAQLSIVSVWCSMWGEDGRGRVRLPKYETKPITQPAPALLEAAAYRLVLLALTTEELAHRARSAFTMMEVHLCTPPAPTFAPLIVSLASLLASIESSTRALIWGDGTERTEVFVAAMYNLLQAAVLGTRADQSINKKAKIGFLLDRGSVANRARWDGIVNAAQSSHGRDLSWLPSSLFREASQPLGLRLRSEAGGGAAVVDDRQAQQRKEDGFREHVPSIPPVSHISDEEDIGEAI